MRAVRIRVLCLGAVVLLPLLVSLEGVAASQPQYGGELIYAYGITNRTFFPGYELGSNEQEIWLYVYENLVEINERNELIPWLAKSWEFSEDGKTCIMHLREGVEFTDGTPFNAGTVEFVFEETIRQKFVAANLLEGLEDVEPLDEYTVAFHFDAPMAAFIPNLAYRSLCIWNPTLYKEHGPEYMNTHAIGTGPFILDEWKMGEYVRFVRNPNYWQPGLPYLDAIKIVFVPDDSVRAMMLETGEVDRTTRLKDFDLARLKANPYIRVRTVPSTRQYYVILNHMVHPLDNPLVRRALNYAIDKKGIISSVFAGVGATLPKAPILSEGVVGFTDLTNPGEDTLYPYNPERAALLFRKAGYEDRNGDGVLEDPKGNPLKLELWATKGRYKGDAALAELLQTMLRQAGVDVELRFWEAATYFSMLSLPPEKAEYDMALLSWGIPTADPDEPMMLMFYSKSWKPFGSNRMFYYNEKVDELAVAAHHEIDPTRRREIIAEWGRVIIEDAPIIFLPTLTLNLASRTYVHGDRILPVENYPARFAWLDKEEMERQGIKR